MCLIDFERARREVEADLGIEIDYDTASKVLRHTALKCVALKKGTDYLEVLYKNELHDHYTRMAVCSHTESGGAAYV